MASLLEQTDENLISQFAADLFPDESGILDATQTGKQTARQKRLSKLKDRLSKKKGRKEKVSSRIKQLRELKKRKKELKKQGLTRGQILQKIALEEEGKAGGTDDTLQTKPFKNIKKKIKRAKNRRQAINKRIGKVQGKIGEASNLSFREQLEENIDQMVLGQVGLNKKSIEAAFRLGTDNLREQLEQTQNQSLRNMASRGILRGANVDAQANKINIAGTDSLMDLVKNLEFQNKEAINQAKTFGTQAKLNLLGQDLSKHFKEQQLAASAAQFNAQQAFMRQQAHQQAALNTSLQGLQNQFTTSTPQLNSKGQIQQPVQFGRLGA